MFKTLLKFKGLLMTYSISTSYLTAKEFLFFSGILTVAALYHLSYWIILVTHLAYNMV